jgi:hypothetical protein
LGQALALLEVGFIALLKKKVPSRDSHEARAIANEADLQHATAMTFVSYAEGEARLKLQGRPRW